MRVRKHRYAQGGMITVKSEDGEVLRYKIDTDEKSIEVDEATKQYLSDIALVTDRNFRKIKDTYIFWYDDMSDSDIVELEDVFQTSLNKFSDGGETEMFNTLTKIESDFKSFKPDVPFLPFYQIPSYQINVDKQNSIVTAEFYDESGVEKKSGSGEAHKYIFSVPYTLGKTGVFVSPQLPFTILKESYLQELKNQFKDWASNFNWYRNVQLGFNYVDMEGGRIYKFSIKLISIPKIEPKKPEPKEEQSWTITYSTENDNTDKVWVYGRNEDEAIENAKDEYWDIKEIISVQKNMADGGELENDTFVMLFKAYGFVEKRGSYGTRTFYNVEHNAQIYYDPKYRSISGYVGGGEGNDEVIPYSVDGVLDFFIEHDITESESTPFAKGGEISNPYEELLLANGFRKSLEVKKDKYTEYRKGRWYCSINKATKEIEVGKYDFDYSDKDIKKYGGIREDDAPYYHSNRYTYSFSKFKDFLDNYVLDEQYTMAEGGKVGGKKYKREKYVSIPVQVGDFFFDRPNAKSGYYNYRLVKSIDGKNTTVVIADRDYNGRISEKSNPFILQTKYVQNVIDDVRKEQFEKEQNIKEGVFNLSKEIGADKAKGGDLKIPKVRAQLYAILKKMASVETNVKDSSVGAAPNSMSFRASQSGTAISIDTNDVYRGGYYDGSTPYILQVKVGGALSYDKQKIVLTVLKSLLSKYTFTTELGSSRVKETDGTNWSSVMLTAPSSGSSYSPLRALNDFKSIRSLADGGMMADGGMISLSKYYKTLPNKELLVGLKVYDKINDEYIYIKDVDSGIWASKNKNDELGHYYKMSNLMIEEYADGGIMTNGGKVLDLKDVYYDLSNRVGRLQINDETDDYISCDIRDWGNWEHDYEDYERDEEDFEDDDSMILSDSSAKIMQDIVEQVRAKYPSALIKWNTSEKNYIDFNISRKMAAGGNVWDEDLNVYTLVSSKEYFSSDTASDKRRWFRRNRRGLSRDEAKRMAQGYIDRYGKENVYIGNVRHYR